MLTRTVKSWPRDILAVALIALFSGFLLAAPAQAAGPAGPTRLELRANHILGVLPAFGSPLIKQPFDVLGNLDYHGGPVMHTNSVFAIYWIPPGYTVSTKYKSLINGFFKNVAAASGHTTNVYYSDTQYTDTISYAHYLSTFVASATDIHPFPASGCSDPGTAVCLTDGQIQTEIKRVIAAHGWLVGPNRLFFMFTPQNVGTCADGNPGSPCSYSYFCAYHSFMFNSQNKVILYANMPYAAWGPNCSMPNQPKPNGDDADYTINVASHEHNEAITDEQGNAWWDSLTGNENGDNCAWTFGTALGSTLFGQYNQVIGAGKYYLQQEWSNHSTACVLTGR